MVSEELVGSAWQVSTQPSSTSSGVSALFARMVTVPSRTKAMHVAQLPASHEKGAARLGPASRLEHGVAGAVRDLAPLAPQYEDDRLGRRRRQRR